ncbi:MAG TPA: signal recognition particle protein [Chloroflexota bacterium]|nr:signal recognition particle protein [Chloroflexota bacterium]
MFEALTDRLQGVFKDMRGKGRLAEEDIDAALREVRLALLEADVNFKVARDFVRRVKERATATEVLESLTPAQQVLQIVDEELVNTLGGEPGRIDWTGTAPAPVMLVGPNGAGKTTSAAKLALTLRKLGQRPLLVACDTYRPAAVNQLVTLGKQIGTEVYEEGTQPTPVEIAKRGIQYGREHGYTVALIDTAGRLQIDEQMMGELVQIKEAIRPTEVLLVANAMTGQEAVSVAQQFHEQVGLTGLILTQMDGDARGGAALSIRAVTGVPLKFLGMGEKIEPLQTYYPDRLASRILGLGDMLSLIEQTQDLFDQEEAEKLQKKLVKGQFTLDDFLGQLQQIKRMGSLSSILDMIPGMSQLNRRPEFAAALDDKQFKRVEAIILSMTHRERQNPVLIDGSRRRRIARGSGTSVNEVNTLLNQFRQMQGMMKQIGRGKMPKGMAGLLGG